MSYYSPVFGDMFQDSKEPKLQIDDEPSYMKELFRYMYTGETGEIETVGLSEKYEIFNYTNNLLPKIIEKIDMDTVSKYIGLAEKYHISQLRDKCFEFISQHY